MTQALPQVSLDSSRLVRCLTELAVSGTAASQRQFTERLGQLIDFSDSIALSAAHARDLAVDDDAVAEFREGITGEFLRARSTLIQAAMRAFYPGAGPSRIKWPARETAIPVDAAAAAAPYLRFYQAQQADIDSKVRGLHLRTRQAVAGLSPRLARICAIDEALGDALALHARRFLAVVPRLLERRCNHLYESFTNDLAAGADEDPRWDALREQLRRDGQALLLAEIEARLLPCLGLVEALNEETEDEN